MMRLNELYWRPVCGRGSAKDVDDPREERAQVAAPAQERHILPQVSGKPQMGQRGGQAGEQ